MQFYKQAYRTVFRGFKNTSAYRGEGTLLPDQTLCEHYIWLWHLFTDDAVGDDRDFGSYTGDQTKFSLKT